MIVFFFLLEDVEDWAFDASLLRPWEAHVWGQLLVAGQRMGGMSGVFPHTRPTLCSILPPAPVPDLSSSERLRRTPF